MEVGADLTLLSELLGSSAGIHGLSLVDLRGLQVLADLGAVHKEEVLLADVLLKEAAMATRRENLCQSTVTRFSKGEGSLQGRSGGEIHMWTSIAGKRERLSLKDHDEVSVRLSKSQYSIHCVYDFTEVCERCLPGRR